MNRVMERNKYCTCKNCHKAFEAVHWNAETCSPACRKAYSRWMKELERHEATIMHLLYQIKTYERTDRDDAAFKALTRISKATASILDFWE